MWAVLILAGVAGAAGRECSAVTGGGRVDLESDGDRLEQDRGEHGALDVAFADEVPGRGPHLHVVRAGRGVQRRDGDQRPLHAL